jgi:hypothetical protein
MARGQMRRNGNHLFGERKEDLQSSRGGILRGKMFDNNIEDFGRLQVAQERDRRVGWKAPVNDTKTAHGQMR